MSDSPNTRLFTALWPGPDVRARLAACRDAWSWPPAAKPVPDEKLHATLHFIGSFPRARLGALSAALATVGAEPIDLEPIGIEVWRGGIAVLTLRAEPRLTALHARIGSVLSGLGVALDERPFAPHVTMARKAWHARPPPALPELAWRAAGFALVESRPGRPSASYAVLSTWSAIVSG